MWRAGAVESRETAPGVPVLWERGSGKKDRINDLMTSLEKLRSGANR